MVQGTKHVQIKRMLLIFGRYRCSALILSKCFIMCHTAASDHAVKSNCTGRMMDVCMKFDSTALQKHDTTALQANTMATTNTINLQRYKTHSGGSLNFINIFRKCKLGWEESNLEDPTVLEYKGKNNVYPFRMWYSQKGKHWERICSSALNQSPHLY